MAQNPFTPTFGVTPPMLVGRDEEISTFADALDDGPGAPGRAMLFTGVRGSGKTVMLNAVEDAAARRGWLVISETTRPGVADELTKTVLPGLLSEHHLGAVRSHVTGANASAAGFGGAVTRQRVERFPVEPSLRSEVEALTDALRPHQRGVLISLDEVHPAALQDLRQITQAVQHAFRQGRELAFVAAGLPSAVQDVLGDEVMTFLRRAERFTLGAVSVDDVKQALLRPIEDSGRTITPTALRVAAEGTKGYPFLVQLVEATGHGRVDFTLPYLRDYLREYVATVALGEDSALLRGSDGDRRALPPGGTSGAKTVKAEADSPEHDGQ